MILLTGSTLQGGKYQIIRALSQGGFGITYEAEQIALHRRVAIKEFFMKEYCDRDPTTSHVSLGISGGSKELVDKFRTKFIREAQMIAGLDNPHIIKIHDIFEENGTAYYVMPFLNGGSLADKVKQNGPMPEQEALGCIKQIGDALDYLHKKNILHLDVKPSNVLLNVAGGAVLIDFGISKHYDEVGSQTSTTPVGISKGYAPMEQYQQGSITKFSAATDIYSLGATLYFLLTGQTPPEAADVYEEGMPVINGLISGRTYAAIKAAMEPKRKARPQSIRAFLYLLDGADSESTILSFPTPHREDSPSLKADRFFTVSGCTFKMIFVKGGAFMMGAVSSRGVQRDERPVHKVTINDFYIGETVVTHQLWSAIMGPSRDVDKFLATDPATHLSYLEGMIFIDKLNAILGEKFRLPTEAEWEYAAKGGEKNREFLYSGGDDLRAVGHIGSTFAPVKSKSPNDLGLFDMSGNVNEWCEDWYGRYTNSDQINPHGPLTGYYRVARGGAFDYSKNYCRVSFRNRFEPTAKKKNIGLRLAL